MQRIEQFIRKPKRALFHLAWPVMLGMLVQALYNIVDTAFVGRLGADAIAALTFCFPLLFVLIALNTGIGVGMGSSISRALGAGRVKEAESTAAHGLAISIALAVLIFFLGWFSLSSLFLLLGASEVMELSLSYMRIILMSVFFMFPVYVIHSIFTAQGDTRTPVIIQVSALLLNIILDPIFIYVLGLGVAGAAWATLITLAFALGLAIILMNKRSRLLPRMRFTPSLQTLKEILSVGAPAALTMLLLSVYVIFLNRFMSHFGTEYVAAFGIASRLESLAIMPIAAFSISLLTLVSMFYGARRWVELRNISWYGLRVMAITTSALGLVFFVAPYIFLRIFTSDPMLLSLAALYLRIDVFTFPLMAITMGVSRIMQGLGRGLPGLLVQLTRVAFVALPLAYLFVFIMNLGYLSIAVAMVIGGLAGSTLALIWLRSTLANL